LHERELFDSENELDEFARCMLL